MTTVLVVDDSTADRNLARGLLEKATDWTVLLAENGAEALDQVDEARPDVVLTDLQMPEMDGLELVSRIHADDPLLPVVLMTAAGSEEIAVRALREGAASYVAKSSLSQELAPTLERVLSAVGIGERHARLMNSIRYQEAQFDIANDLDLVSAIVRHLQQGVSQQECLTVATALDEALHNAYYHGNLELDSALRERDSEFEEAARSRRTEEPYADRRIHVTATVTPEEARYVVRDDGPGFDPSNLPDPTDPANLDRPHGRGLLLIRTFMDDVTFNDTGNEITMVKRRA